jgi:GAF domain-containing protein
VEQKDKPVFDEDTLARVLEAAYVLQEHNRTLELNLELQSEQLREQHAKNEPPTATSPPEPDNRTSPKDAHTRILAEIVETQHQIQVRQLELESTLALVADRLLQITGAIGTAIGIVEGKIVLYRAGSGPSALPRGSKLSMEKALCFTALRTGQVMRCADVNPEFLLDAEECHRRGILSVIAVPVYHEGGVAGALELHYDKANGFTDQDVHSCQLMAGLVTEALTRDAQLTWKKSLAVERATMLEAIEKLRPNLAALVQVPAVKESETNPVAQAPVAKPSVACRKCGHALVEEEQFCGKCGSPRGADAELPSMQSKVASLWQLQQSKSPSSSSGGGKHAAEAPGEHDFGNVDSQEEDLKDPDGRERELAKLLANSLPDFSVAHDPADVERSAPHPRPAQAAGNPEISQEEPVKTEHLEGILVPLAVSTETEDSAESATATALEKVDQDITWTSATKAREFLEQVARLHKHRGFQLFWNARRGDIYLAIAVILMAIVIRWGVWSDHAVGATGSGAANSSSHRKADADLSMLDRWLIGLGLAEPPDKPEPKGNPETQVWVDLHTALYYCPGTDLYGKTPKGKYTSQKDAQLDQFEPAYRKACD